MHLGLTAALPARPRRRRRADRESPPDAKLLPFGTSLRLE